MSSKKHNQMGVRARLTTVYVLILALSFTLFGTAVFVVVRRQLLSEVDNYLVSKAQEVRRGTTVSGQWPILERVLLPNVDVLSTPDTFLQVRDLSGVVQARSQNLGNQSFPIQPNVFATAQGGQAVFQTLQVGTMRFRQYAYPLATDPGHVIGVLQVVRALTGVDATLARLSRVLLGGAVLSVLLAALLGWAIADTALKPLEHMASTAEAIANSHDVTQRVRYTGADDEVGRLASMFNLMLSDIDNTEKKLRQSIEAQRRFVADASHELRTPLTTIQGNIDVLRALEDENPVERAAALDDMAAETGRLTRMVNQLLTLARADAGQHLTLERIEIEPVFEAASRAGANLADGKLSFASQASDDFENAIVMGSGDALKQLLLILLDNAVKYTPAGRSVALVGRVTGDEVEVAVQDEGFGMSDEVKAHLFERFYRATRVRELSGTGLGLSIAAWIINEHGGRLQVESAEGQGSTFTVILPLTPPESQPDKT
jgi:signal transduction histidine kinase